MIGGPPGSACYSLGLDCPAEAGVLKAGSPGCQYLEMGLLGGDWVIRALVLSVE